MYRELPFHDLMQIVLAMLDGYRRGNVLVYVLPIVYVVQCVLAFYCLHLANIIDPARISATFCERSFATRTIDRFHDQAARFVVVSSIGLLTFTIRLTFNSNNSGALIITWFRSYPAFIFSLVQISSLIRNAFALWRDLGME